MYGLQICTAAGLPTGTIRPIFARFEGIGWLESRWEDAGLHGLGRLQRRYYRFTPDGVEMARQALARTQTKIIKP